MTTIKILDTETTSLKDPKIVEIGSIEIDEQCNILNTQSEYINPEKDIDVGAFLIHGINPAMVRDKPTFDQVYQNYIADIVVCHNVPFDKGVLESYHFTDYSNTVFIDTLKLARTHLPEMKSHKNASLFFELGLYEDFEAVGNLHSALYDASITSTLVKHFCKMFNCKVSELKQYESIPYHLQKCPFNKHKGKSWQEVLTEDLSYVKWLTGNIEFRDNDLKEWLIKEVNQEG